MSDIFIIAIGGSGAQCVEALLHLLAAGVGDYRSQTFHIIMVDSDRGNGSGENVRTLIAQYTACATGLNWPTVKFEGNWGQFPANATFSSYFNFSGLDSKTKLLVSTLFSRHELSSHFTLENGFRGHPHVGAALLRNELAALRDRNNNMPAAWRELDNAAKSATAETQPRVVLFGSVFGGAGAAGIPTLARFIRHEWKQQVKLAGVLLLPYFEFENIEDPDELCAQSADFLPNTKAALWHYVDHGVHEHFDALYAAGPNPANPAHTVKYPLIEKEEIRTDERGQSIKTKVMVPCLGGNSQANPSHFAHLYGALAALGFLAKSPTGHQYHRIARETLGGDPTALRWSDLPWLNSAPTTTGGETARRLGSQQMKQFARFAMACQAVYIPTIRQGPRPHQAPWFADYFYVKGKNALNLSGEPQEWLNALDAYTKRYLCWLAEVQASAGSFVNSPDKRMVMIERLVKSTTPTHYQTGYTEPNLTSIRAAEWSDIISETGGEAAAEISGLRDLWHRISKARLRKDPKDRMHAFFQALHASCD